MAGIFRPPLQHLDSDCLQQLTGNVADTLIQALVQEDLILFSTALSSAEPEDVDKFHGFPRDKTCLDVACEKGLSHCVSLLLRFGADPNKFNPASKTYPLHVAVRNLHAECAQRLVKARANVNALEGNGSCSALHVLLRSWSDDQSIQEKFYKCFDVLISASELDINTKDNDESTALELAVRQGLTDVVHKLINLGAKIDENVQEAMEEYMPDILERYREEINSQNAFNNNATNWDSATFERDLWLAVKNHRVDKVRTMLQAIQSGNVGFAVNLDSASSTCTLLQQACLDQLGEVVKLLLESGCDPNQVAPNDNRPPLVIAAHLGNEKILDILLDHPKTRFNCTDHGNSKQTALHKITQKLPTDKQGYLRCLQLVLQKAVAQGNQNGTLNVNAQDVCGNTALHYAAHSGVEDAVLELLRHGSNFGMKNALGEAAIARILPATLESFLDKCLQVNDEGMASREFYITFNYSPLAPPLPAPPASDARVFRVHEENGDGGVVEQENCLQSIPSGTEEDIYPESEALWHLSQSSRHQHLLRHPVVTSFLMLKWHKVRNYFYANLAIYTSAVLVLTAYILLRHSAIDPEDFSYKAALNVLWYLLVILIAILSVRELFQLGVAPLRYLFSLENYVEVGMLGCTAAVLCNTKDPSSSQHLSAIAVLLAWLEFLLLIGRHPRLSTFIAMFTTVSLTFLRLLLWYSVLLIGFALSFFLLFQQPPEPPAASETQDKNQTDKDVFQNVPSSLLKVVVMMTGELEFGDLPFDGHPATSRAIFVSFVFLITIVLLNLLNGMAVSDTQAIQSKAETIGYASRVDLISYMESMLLGDPFHFLANWPPFTWLQRCPSFNLVSRLMQGRWLRRIFKAEGTVLFYNCLPDKSFTVYPNRKAAFTSLNKEVREISCKCHSTFHLDNGIVQSACARLQERDRDTSAELSKQIQALQDAIRSLHLQQEEIFRRVNKHSQ